MDKRLARLRAGAFGVLGAAGFLLLFGPLLAKAWGWTTRARSPEWWGAAGQWAGAVGTVLAVAVALWIAIRDGRVARADRRQRDRRERQEQASKVTAWIERDGRRTCMVVSNANAEAVNHVVVSFDLVRSLPMTGSTLHRGPEIEDDEYLFAVLPPGKWRMAVPETRLDTDLTPGVMIAFSDSRNGHWLRLTDGALIEKDQNVVGRRKIRFPQRISVPESY
ncbi:hypothetical protein VA596_43215 [Amycolatopsis sp., V23-08]|uniref:Uncharacterized protein n=1 Tax=Amycolatopsis heterodermiae TaxID=3110235 RepID=A0ABU5RL02_9PSEU|nr:hypothetical protein [Amycolatopsis sp., V23-08]MEA5366404.1 hypothetical protein [Amycolatopsis sp., V23-08]